jgi:TPR repeat protein
MNSCRRGIAARNSTTTIRRLGAALALAGAMAAQALAGGLEDGLDAYQQKDYAKAIQLWRPLAEKGDPSAQFRLGTLYLEGKGVAADDVEAAKWFLLAANQGEPTAQYNLGASYAEGTGVKQDDAEAARWFRRAADQGMVYAQLNIGIMYIDGKGVPQDLVEAVKWLDLAIYKLPAGGPRSDAARALTAAAAKLKPEEVDEARRREREWKPKVEMK